MNIHEAAEMLNVKERFVRNRCSKRYCAKTGVTPIRFCRLGNRLRFRQSDIDEYLRATELAVSKNTKA